MTPPPRTTYTIVHRRYAVNPYTREPTQPLYVIVSEHTGQTQGPVTGAMTFDNAVATLVGWLNYELENPQEYDSDPLDRSRPYVPQF